MNFVWKVVQSFERREGRGVVVKVDRAKKSSRYHYRAPTALLPGINR